jgi:hypothetical protein
MSEREGENEQRMTTADLAGTYYRSFFERLLAA